MIRVISAIVSPANNQNTLLVLEGEPLDFCLGQLLTIDQHKLKVVGIPSGYVGGKTRSIEVETSISKGDLIDKIID